MEEGLRWIPEGVGVGVGESAGSLSCGGESVPPSGAGFRRSVLKPLATYKKTNSLIVLMHMYLSPEADGVF